MDKRAKIYVAGHDGLVGSALMRGLKEEGYENIIYRAFGDLDLRRQAVVENFFKSERPDYVFLAAAKVGGILANSTYKAEFIYDNIMIASNVIYSAYSYGVKKLINLGSSCIYPKLADQPLKEDSLLTGSLEPTNEPYAIAKIAAIKLCRYFNEQYNTDFISVMPANLYGPHDNFNLETGHVLPMMVRKFHLAKLLDNGDIAGIRNDLQSYPVGFGIDNIREFDKKEAINSILNDIGIQKGQLTLWGSGEPFRELLYVDDLAEACIFFMKNLNAKDLGEFVNIGTGKDQRIKDIAQMVKEVVGFDGSISWNKINPDGTPRKVLDVSRVNELGWKAMTELKDGIKRLYAWYLK